MLLQDVYFYFKIGWEHIVSADALDHQLFILSLITIYSFKKFKQVLILVTAFTIGHSLTLLLSVLDVFRFSTVWVEFLIPCTIFITALSNLFHTAPTNKSVQINYYLALVFGLIHGMGFANSVRMMLANDQNLGWDLFGFNIGLETGQIFIVAILLSVFYFIFTYTKVRRRDWILFLSAAVFSLAFKMALERLPL